METLNRVCSMFEINNKDTRTTSVTFFKADRVKRFNSLKFLSFNKMLVTINNKLASSQVLLCDNRQ